MSYFKEENVETMFIDTAVGHGWHYVEAENVPRLADEVLVTQWLVPALVKLNPITPEQAEQVIYKLRSAILSGGSSEELINANDRFRRLLFEENSYPFGEDGDNINIRFFSDEPTENYCIVTNQWEFPRPTHKKTFF